MSSEGGTNLAELIKSMSPSLDGETYVFAHVPATSDQGFRDVFQHLPNVPIQMLFREDEGWTVVVAQDVVERVKLQSAFPCKKITLKVHSSLDAVGFMAAITKKLRELSCGVNPVSGYFHDHLFVPVGKENAVLEALKDMADDQI